ncbi:type II toxin-antitoxin system VapC family toxin [Plectonema cf. radiosum LEGE 06105]|uniref:Type II toxin-antitoxin system VapC family toxin n=1 Tax=Plectonema cf. radiosum LEGE 06105 TaxID=945769 RepID=A0A8J7F304_9CYAN|nr:type II toxin-antitoxin system VapC family toxin [Plectonema radiosum]MBE9215256.1 type II toxin-antitoxin system VapC family toxin [Plectonema cf. radiosum LEGE 06105]
MNILLDTHTFIWSTANPESLSQTVTNLLTDTNNTWILSIASVWEMQIKLQLGKLNLNSSLPNLIDNQQRVNNLQILPIDLTHIYALNNLPSHHKDPFDRILIAQAMVEQIPIVSIDEVFDNYPIKRLW